MLSQALLSRNLPRVLMLAGLVSCAQAAPTYEDVNAALGLPLLGSPDFWSEPVDAVATRIGWPQESKTSTESSFRKYPGASDRVLGARPYSLALYGDAGHPSQVSMVFANKGDSAPSDLVAGDQRQAATARKELRSMKSTMQADAKEIETRLTTLFGQPVPDRFGQGRQTRESVKRWDWSGHSFLQAAPEGEYVAVRIVPPEVADAQGRSRIPQNVMHDLIEKRVTHRANGDVILTDIPMVDQGPKGYCVPATWERAMRYMGVPADMYILAMAGATNVGGGTAIAAIAGGAKEAIMRGGRRLDVVSGKISVRDVKKYIDHGLPLIWALYSTPDFNKAVNSRLRDRAGMSDPAAWSKQLDMFRKAAKKLGTNPEDAHVCMVIGYNEKTRELAVSDSWGPQFTERWVTEEEAAAVTQGALLVINL